MMRITRLLSVSALGVIAVATTVPAFAQDTAADQQAVAEDGLNPTNDIIVSARRRDESVQDVPQTVNVVTAEQVDKLNLRNFTDLTAVVPGLTLTAGSFGSSATVRGVSFSPEASGNNPTVEFYLNDAPVSSNLVFQSLFDVGQFELQRGPQGTLRGRASPSGSFLFRTRQPNLDEVGGVVNGTITNTRVRKFDGALNVPIIAGVLGIRVAGVIDHSQGDRVRSIKQQLYPQFNIDPYRRTQALRANVRFEPTDWISAGFMFQTLQNKVHSYTQVQSACLVTGAACPAPTVNTPLIRPFDRLSVQDQGSFSTQRQKIYIGNVDVKFSGQKLSYVGSYNTQEILPVGGNDAGDFFQGTTARTFADPVGFDAVCRDAGLINGFTPTNGEFYQCTHTRAARESHELRLASDERIGGIFDYVVGALIDKSDSPSTLTSETALGGAAQLVNTTAIQRTGGKTLERSIFGNITAHIGDSLEVSGGLRYIHFKADPSSTIVGTSTNISPGNNDKKLIYSGSIKYEVMPNINVYATIGSSMRPGPRAVGNFSIGPTGVEGPSALERSFTDLPAETSTSYEIGLKTSFANGRGRFNVSAYQQDFQNYVYRGPGVLYVNYSTSQGVVSPSVGSFNFLAAVPVRVRGVEAEASFNLTDRWSIGANVSYANGQIRNGRIPCTDLNQDGIPDVNPQTPANAAALQAVLPAGQNIAVCNGYNARSLFTPKFSGNIQSEFGFDIADNMTGFLRGLFSFTGENAGDPGNAFDNLPFYGLLNLYAGVQGANRSWEITAYAKNVLNDQRVLSTSSNPLSTQVRFDFRNATTVPSSYVGVNVSAPREFGLTARFAFGSR